MIVKNESHVITRCLESLKRLLDYVLIIDTGSTDNTIETIENWLKENNIPGEVIIEPWKNFSYNRTFALSKVYERQDIDYALMIDADELLIFEEDFNVDAFKSNLICDVYDVQTNMNGLIYYRPTLTSNKKVSSYKGVVHEFLDIGQIETRDIATGFYNLPIQDSSRNQSGQKYEKDAALLEEILKDPNIDDWFKSRYTFYLAQSYRDSGQRELSLKNYLLRAEQGHWSEEVYISLYCAGNLMKELDYSSAEVIQTYMRANEVCPYRAESLYAALFYCRINSMHNQGYMIGKHAIDIPLPDRSLFTETWVYNYGLLDEFSIVAFYSGHFLESKLACERLLSEGKIPEYFTERIKSNLQFALDRLN